MDLNDPTLFEPRAYLNGAWVRGAGQFSVSNPATGHTISDVADLSVDDAKDAIDAAQGCDDYLEIKYIYTGGIA